MKESIIAMAREAGFNVEQGFLLRITGIDEDLKRFAELVTKEAEREIGFDKAELWLKRINEAVLAEREACAKVCEDSQAPSDWNLVAVLWKECKNKLAAAIRARGASMTDDLPTPSAGSLLRIGSPRVKVYTADQMREFAQMAALAEREACLNCYSPDDTAEDWADKIRART